MTVPGAQHFGDSVPLDQRYLDAEPIDWCGAAVYPMYTEALPAGTTAVRLRALSVMPPPEVSGLGLGLSVQAGHVNLDGRSLAGVDIWQDALVDGIDITVTADAPDALFTLTPVWVAGSGAHQSWTGNYGMVVDLLPDGGSTLWCSTGPGTPDFNELVVELTTVPAQAANNAPSGHPPPAPVDTPPASAQAAAATPPKPPDAPTTTSPSTDADFEISPSLVTTPLTPISLTPRPSTAPHPMPATSPAPAPTPITTAPPVTAEQAVGRALHDLGTAMYARGDHDSARTLWTQAAEAGHRGAARDLGMLLARAGEGEAAQHWLEAADRADARAAASMPESSPGS